ITQSIELVRAARELGVEFVCASGGGIIAGITVPVAPNYQVPFASALRKATGMKARAVGLITEPHQAEQILIDGHADMIALARASMDDRRWGWHAADVLGAKTHSAQPYHLARSAGWRKFRDQIRAGVKATD